ncbi:MAG: hypothetical protein ABF617_02230 [Gluconobacter japonicus]|uniref:hypothetical protein n=1 Tax=Gluconobacter japonicus TaxID=376620 RepID=UPI0039E79DC6
MLKSFCLAVLVGCTMHPSEAMGINTFVPPSFAVPPASGRYDVTPRQLMPGAYTEAPQPRMIAPPALTWTASGKVFQFLRRQFSGNGSDRVGVGGVPAVHDPVSGSAIGQFGEAYAQASPMGMTGITPHGNTVN